MLPRPRVCDLSLGMSCQEKMRQDVNLMNPQDHVGHAKLNGGGAGLRHGTVDGKTKLLLPAFHGSYFSPKQFSVQQVCCQITSRSTDSSCRFSTMALEGLEDGWSLYSHWIPRC